MTRTIFQILGAILGLYLASRFIDGVIITDKTDLIISGVVLGLINSFLKPILKLLTLPLRILTLGLFSIVLNMLLIQLADVLLVELDIKTITALFWTTMIVWFATFIVNFYKPKKKIYPVK